MKKYIIVALLFIGFIGSFPIYFIIVSSFYPDMTLRGQFGDMLGGLNAFFSGLAFLGLIYAILLQRKELSLQRKELELTRKELARTAKAQEKSERALAKQAASLKATAKLNGLSSVLQHCDSLIEVTGISQYGSAGIDQRLKEKAEQVIEEIQDIIGGK